ncbi:conjugal transfer nickase/helicase TraI [Klebsiella pneumoniae]|nr:conjugal transfer nickase/helicase TraI [Klebsiella pneumoniae]
MTGRVRRKRRYRMILSSGAREEAIQQVASERLQRERLQAVERDMVRDLNREKTLGATDAPAACLLRQPPRLKSGSLPER